MGILINRNEYRQYRIALLIISRGKAADSTVAFPLFSFFEKVLELFISKRYDLNRNHYYLKVELLAFHDERDG